jgi:hypothetical protein
VKDCTERERLYLRVSTDQTKVGNDELHNLHPSPDNIKVIESKGMRGAEYAARIGEVRNLD